MDKIDDTNDEYTQVYVWEGTLISDEWELSKEDIERFESVFKDKFDTRIKYFGQVVTLPDMAKGGAGLVKGTGGRIDQFFFVNNNDIEKFETFRLDLGIRWWEHVLEAGHAHRYPKEWIEKLYDKIGKNH